MVSVFWCLSACSASWLPAASAESAPRLGRPRQGRRHVLIVSTGGGRLDGLDRDGRQIWRFPEIWEPSENKAEKLKGIYGAPVLSSDGRVVFVGDYNGYIYAFRPGDYIPATDAEQPRAGVYKLDGPIIGGIAAGFGERYALRHLRQPLYSIRACQPGRTHRKQKRGRHGVKLFETGERHLEHPRPRAAASCFV